MDRVTITVGDSRNLFFIIDKTNRQEISKNMEDMNNINQSDLIDVDRTFHPTVADYTLFSSTHRAFTKISHILGHKTNLNKFESIQAVQIMFSDLNGIKLEVIRNISGKSPNM